jgi:hypothetical protein
MHSSFETRYPKISRWVNSLAGDISIHQPRVGTQAITEGNLLSHDAGARMVVAARSWGHLILNRQYIKRNKTAPNAMPDNPRI